MSSYEDVTKYYIDRLASQDVIDDLSAVMEAGVPLKPVVETITSAGTMRGLHSVDNAIRVGPVIHAFLKKAMETQGVSVRDTGRNYEKEAAEKEAVEKQEKEEALKKEQEAKELVAKKAE